MAVRYRGEMVSSSGVHSRLDIHDASYTGSPNQLPDFATGGYAVSYPGNDDERYAPIKGSSIDLFLMVDSPALETLIIDIANAAEQRFSVVLYKNGYLDWSGHIAPDLIEQPDDVQPYNVRLVATDYLGALTMNWEAITGWGLGLMTFQDILLDLLSYTGLSQFFNADDAWLKMSVNWYAANMPEYDTTEAYKDRVLADAGQWDNIEPLREAIAESRAVLLEDTSCYLLNYRDRVEADGGTVVNLFAALEDSPDSRLLTAGTYGLDGYNPWTLTQVSKFAFCDKLGEVAASVLVEEGVQVGFVLSQILKRFGCRIYQAEGAFCIDQIQNFSNDKTLTRWYYKSGDELFGIWDEARSYTATLKLSGGVGKFYRPLNAVEVVYRTRLDVNLATFRLSGLVQLGAAPSGEGYRLGVTVDLNSLRLEGATVIRYFRLWWRVRLVLLAGDDTYYLTNGNPDASGGLNRQSWIPSATAWTADPTDYYHVMIDGFRQQGINESTDQFQIVTPELPVSGQIFYTTTLYGFLTPSNQFTAGEPPFLLSRIVNEKLYLIIDAVVDSTRLISIAENNNQNFETLTIDDMRTGDGAFFITPGCLIILSNTPLLSGGWRRNYNNAALDIGKLLATEVLSGQQQASRRVDAGFILPGSYSLRSRIVRGNKAYIFNGVNYNAEQDIYSGTWVEVANVTTGITVRVANKLRSLPYLPPIPELPTADVSAQLSTSLQLDYKQLDASRITIISTDISAGAVTSLPIDAIGEVFLQAGDKLGVVSLDNGRYYEATLTATPADNATALAVSSITLPFVEAGSPLIVIGRRIYRDIKVKDSGWIAGLQVLADAIGTGADKVRINTTDGDVVAERNIKAVNSILVGAIDSPKVTLDGATGNIDADGNVQTEKDLQVKEKVIFLGLNDTEPTVTGTLYIKIITIGEVTERVIAIKEA